MAAVDVTKPHVRAATVQFDGDADELLVTRWTVQESLDWCPAIEAQLQITLPVGFDTDLLDPRTPTPITLRLNTYPMSIAAGLDPDQTAIFRLIPRAVDIDWVAREATLTANSTDMLSLWYTFDEVTFTASDTLETVMIGVREAYAPTPLFIGCDAPALTLGETTVWRRNVTGAAFLRDIADAAFCELIGSRDASWSMVELAAINDSSDPVMTLGPARLTELRTRSDVDRFGNAATTQYENERWAQTQQTAGPYAVSAIGRRTRYVDQTGIPLDTASSSGVILRRALRRGEQLELRALAHHPIKVGDWVRVDWNADLDVTRRVDRLTFTDDGLMSLTCTDPNSTT
jgi:hypothetical protein